jgi:hypothetical protein
LFLGLAYKSQKITDFVAWGNQMARGELTLFNSAVSLLWNSGEEGFKKHLSLPIADF